MNRQGFLNMLLLGLLLALLGLLAALHTNPAKRNDYWLKGMDESPAPADYSVNPNFPNGRTLQMPPEGTLPQGWKPYHFKDGTDGALAAGKALRNPYAAADKVSLERGFQVYMRTCLPCHGTYGRGDGKASLNKREGGYPAVANLLSEHTRGVADGFIYNYIARGGVIMPSYGAQIDPEDRWKVVTWVRHLQKNYSEAAPEEGSPAAKKEAEGEAELIVRTTPGATPGSVPTAMPTAVPTAVVAPTKAAEPEKAAEKAALQAPVGAKAPAAKAAATVATAVPSAAKPASVADSGAPVTWDQAQALMKKSDCFTCHNLNAKVVGPAFKEIAKRYSGKAGALEQLVKKVKMGGAGNWGAAAMTAHPTISEADLTVMVKGVLSLAGKHAALPSLKQVLAMAQNDGGRPCPALSHPKYLAGATAERGFLVAKLSSRERSQEEVQP